MDSAYTAFLYDAKRFILMSMHIATDFPLQLYSACLIFSPTQSMVRTLFEKEILERLKILPRTNPTWSAKLQATKGHTGDFSVSCVAFSPDGEVLASSSDDHTIMLWDSKTLRDLRTLKGHIAPVNSAFFSPDGQIVASASDDRTIKLWDTKTGKELETLRGHCDKVNCAIFSPDGRFVVSGSDDKTIKIWATLTAETPRTLEGHEEGVTCLAFSGGDHQLLVSGSEDTTVRLWSTTTDTEIQKFEGHDATVTSVVCHPNTQTVISSSHDCEIIVWDGDIDEDHPEYCFPTGFFGTRSIALSPDGKTMVSTAESDIQFQVPDSEAGMRRYRLTGSEKFTCLAFTPDSQTLASGSEHGAIQLWDINMVETLGSFEDVSPIHSTAISADGRLLASLHTAGWVRVWDVNTGANLSKLGPAEHYYSGQGYKYLNFSADNQFVQLTDFKGQERDVWNIYSHERIDPADEPQNLVWSARAVPETWQKSHLMPNGWIAHDFERLICLPVEYQNPNYTAVYQNLVLLGYVDGEILIFGFCK